jgi:hypothetical protein
MPGRLDTAEQDRGCVRELRAKASISSRAFPAGGDRDDPLGRSSFTVRTVPQPMLQALGELIFAALGGERNY